MAFLLMSSLYVEFGFCHLLIFRVGKLDFEVSILFRTTTLVELQAVIAMLIDRTFDR